MTEKQIPPNNQAARRIAKFIHMLRHMGIHISIAESLDAMNALSCVNPLIKSQVKDALRATLAKSQEDCQIFDHAFERYFVQPEEEQYRLLRRRNSREELEKGLREAEFELKETLNEWQEYIPNSLQPSREQLETFQRMPAKERNRLKDIIKSMQGNPVNNPGELIARVMQSSLNYWRYYMLKNQAEKNKTAGSKRHLEPTGMDELDELLEEMSVEFFHKPGDEILHRDMQWIDDSQLNIAAGLIKQMSTKMATRLSRRYHRSSRAQDVDIRRTIRHNMRYGGTPIQLCYRSKRFKKPRLVLICDVSASMARYARFVLQFIFGLSSAVKEIETFIFSENLEFVTPHFRVRREFPETMSLLMNQSAQWGKATNFYSSLITLKTEYKYLLTRNSIIFIVSDAKTIAPEQAAYELSLLKQRCQQVIWLNPLPVGEWKDVKGIKPFQQYARMFECNTLAQLDKSLRKQILKLT